MATRTIGTTTTTVVRRKTLGETYIGEWLMTTDHKKIGIMYIVTGFFFFLVGGMEAHEGFADRLLSIHVSADEFG